MVYRGVRFDLEHLVYGSSRSEFYPAFFVKRVLIRTRGYPNAKQESTLFSKIHMMCKRLPKVVIFMISLIWVSLIGYIDYCTGFEISFSIIFLAPIIFVTWYAGWLIGLLTSLACAVTWLVADIQSFHYYSHPAIPVWNAAVRLMFFIIISNLLSKLHHRYEIEKQLATTDPLTGALNRRIFYSSLASEVSRCQRYGRTFTLALIDLDNFKSVNDTLGHTVGDDVLNAVVSTIKSCTRLTDITARIGGDEFALIFPEMNREAAGLAMEKIREALLSCMTDNNWPITFSIGVTIFISPPQDIEQAITFTDDLMYKVKKQGKNGVAFDEFSSVTG